MNNQTSLTKRETWKSSRLKTEDKSAKERGNRKIKGNFFSTLESKSTTIIYSSNILNIDGKNNKKELIDKWAQEITLIVQTNSEVYDDQNTVMLLMEHKTTGFVNSIIKNTTWEPVMSPITACEYVINAIYTLFLGINLVNNKIFKIRKNS